MGKRAFWKRFVYVSVLERGLSRALGKNGGWLFLPTRPQRYCDPASLVWSITSLLRKKKQGLRLLLITSYVLLGNNEGMGVGKSIIMRSCEA